MLLQTQWAQVLNKVVSIVDTFNVSPPTQQTLRLGSGIYNTPANAFYLNVRLSATSGVTSFGPSYLSATSSGPVIPNSDSVEAFFFTNLNYLDAIITDPNSSYPYSVASSGFIVVREYYQ